MGKKAMVTELTVKILASIFAGCIASLAVTPVFCVLRKIFYFPLVRNSLLKDAQEKGNIVVAHYLKSCDIINDDGTYSGKRTGIYQYEYGGKKYRYKIVTTDSMPDELTLYYSKNPRKAALPDAIGFREYNRFLYYIILSAIIAVIVFFTGAEKFL